ncbi:fumarylacetoacetate hydrolase family protein [Fusobacterium sp. PH5-44]|uniref:fumarylacetoacetate hydrolase family protein n=1 Tax=unclassified Fusobacterium TaxID=2648384 RepID=UPI003D232626
MKFVTFSDGTGEKIGIITKDQNKVVEISSILKKIPSTYSMTDFIANSTDEDMKLLKEHLINASSSFVYHNIENIKIYAPIKRPIHDIICVGVNYADHLKEAQDNLKDGHSLEPTETVFFSKRSTNIIGSNEEIIGRFDLDTFLDYEVELAVIIGKRGKDIKRSDAENYIFGYSVFNDISSRKIQKDHGQWFKGKSLDTYSAMGPSIVSKDDIPMPFEISVSTTVNDEVRQSSNTKEFISDIPKIIADLSAGMTLEAGDIIITGTPSGVAMGMRPQKFLQSGDIVTCEIEKIGKLINRVK